MPHSLPAIFCGQKWTGVERRSLLPVRIEGVRSPTKADAATLRLCLTERDAIAASVALSGLTYRELAARMGVSHQLVNAYARGERLLPRKRTEAFCNATGTLLVKQFRDLEKALRKAAGRERERDRIEAIVYEMRRSA